MSIRPIGTLFGGPCQQGLSHRVVLGTSLQGGLLRTRFLLWLFSCLHSHQLELWSSGQRHLYSIHLQTSRTGEWRMTWLELFLFCFLIMEMDCKCTIYMTERAKSWTKRRNFLWQLAVLHIEAEIRTKQQTTGKCCYCCFPCSWIKYFYMAF